MPSPIDTDLLHVERALAEQQVEYSAARERIHALAAAGDVAGAHDTLEHAADLALNLQALHRRHLDLLGRAIAGDAPPAAPPPDAADRLARVTAAIARRLAERTVLESRLAALPPGDHPDLASTLAEAADVDQDLRRLQELELELRRQLPSPSAV